MGRVVQESSVGLWQGAREALVAHAAAERCGGLSDAELASRLEALSNLVPSLRGHLLLLRADLLAELVGDVGAVAQKLVQLRLWFPTADLGELLGRRPSLLGAEEFALIPAARRQLLARFPEPGTAAASGGGCSSSGGGGPGSSGGGPGSDDQTSGVVDGLVTRQPLLLVEDLEEMLAELARLLPGTDAAAALLREPGLADSLACNRKLSLWLMPGQDVCRVVLANPEILLSLQRGTRSLGPGAEFML